MGVLDGCHKIGRSVSPLSRLEVVGAKLPSLIGVVHSIATTEAVWLEAVLHAAHCDRRVRGEWFRLTDEDLRVIKSIAAASTFHDLPQSLLSRYANSLSHRDVRKSPEAGDRLPPEKKSAPKRDYVAGVGAKLAAARDACGMSQVAAAGAAGIGRGNLWQYETDRKAPTLAVLKRLADAYGATVCSLLPEGWEAPAPPAAPAPASPRKRRGKA